MEVIVHVGAPKAGSSALQTALVRDNAALASAGIYCPPRTGQIARGLSGHFRGDRAQAAPSVRRRFASLEEARDWNRSVWERLETELRDRRPEVTILSSEHFVLVDDKAGLVARLRQSFDKITLVVYVRDPVSHFASAIDQSIRDGVPLEHLRQPPGILGKMRSYIEDFGAQLGPADRTILRNVSRSNLTGGDVALDFYDLVGRLTHRDLSGLAPATRVNESLSAPATVWLLGLNGQLGVRRSFGDPADVARIDNRRELIARLRDMPELAGFPKLKVSHPVLREAILDASRDYCAWLNRDWLEGQEPMPVGPPRDQPIGPQRFRRLLRDWLVGQMDPAAVPALMRAALPVPELGKMQNQPRQKKQQGKEKQKAGAS